MPEMRRPRVLVVDDTEGNRYASARILRAAGFDVSEADSGANALSAMDQHPDVVVLDINLPDMTGFEVVERLRKMPQHAAIPVLHLSASYTTDADRARGLDQGADAYLTHPLDPTVFVATVRALLRTSDADRRLRAAAEEWQATFDALGDAVMLLGPAGQVTRANRAACALLGCDEQQPVGHSLGELIATRFGREGAAMVKRLRVEPPLEKAIIQIGDRSFRISADAVHVSGAEARTICVIEDVSERVSAERERETLLLAAESAREEAESANRAKNEFLAVMSHELRTPLNAIGGYAQLLDLGIRGPVTEQQRADLERIKRSQTYLLSLINDVLNFAKIESGHLLVDFEELLLDDLVSGTSDFVQPQLRERALSFSCAVETTGVRVRADREKVQQILLNLLSNALKFTPPGGRITIACSASESDAVITVSDTGQGIASNKLESIFEPFVQVDRRYQREQEGIGLGLAISRELARAMGGDLLVRSSGDGSAFALHLPRVATAAG